MQEKVYFTNASGKELAGIIDRDESKTNQGVVIILGSFNSYKYSAKQEFLAETFKSFGLAVFRFDYQGRGESDGDISFATISTGLEDVRAAVDFIKNQLWVSLDKISLFGSEYGSALAILEAEKNKQYKFLILTAPRPQFETFYDGADIDEWRKNDFYHTKGLNLHISLHDDVESYDVLNVAKRITIPTLIISAENEEARELGQDKRLKRVMKNATVKIVEECNNVHCADAKTQIYNFIKNWLDEKCLIRKKLD
ncbi:MAG: alpha/beta hydrolase [Alphaproteobacteria bacterium]|nr:alpha/beta hydrolase [Alphaproteobacteria bacterium]